MSIRVWGLMFPATALPELWEQLASGELVKIPKPADWDTAPVPYVLTLEQSTGRAVWAAGGSSLLLPVIELNPETGLYEFVYEDGELVYESAAP